MLTRRRLLWSSAALALVAAPSIVRAQQIPLRPFRGIFFPPELPRIDATHSLAIGLCFCVVGRNFYDISSTTRNANLVEGNVTITIGPVGQQPHFGNGVSNTDGVQWTNYSAIKTSNGSGTGDFTIGQIANPAASGSQQNVLFSQRINTGSVNAALLAANANGTSGQFQFFTNSGSAVQVLAASQVNGNYRAYMGVRSGTTVTAYVDGTSVGSSSGTAQTISIAGQDTGIGCLCQDTADNRGANCGIPITAAWNRALSATEVVTWSSDPTCFLIYPDDDIMAMNVGKASSSGKSFMPFFTPPPP